MSADNKHIYTAADIERYHQGLMKSAERHALEKAALDDPFLADALEGYVHSRDLTAEIGDLNNRLDQRVGKAKLVPISRKKERIPWMRVAAILVLLVGGGILASQLLFNKKEPDIAKAEKNAEVDKMNSPADTTAVVKDEAATVTQGFGRDSSVKTGTVKNEVPAANDVVERRAELAPSETSTVPLVTPAREEPAKQKDDDRKDLAKSSEKENDKVENLATEKFDVVKNRQAMSKSRGEKKYADVQPLNTFRGRVTDENNRGLPFANVTNTRDNVGTYTDVSGNFVLTSPDSVLDVQVRSLGYDVNARKLSAAAPDNTIVMDDNVEGVTEMVISRSNSNALRRKQDDNMKVEEPEPADGWENYDVYLANNLQVPEEFETRPSAPREVEVSFEVNKQGEPVQFRIERSLCKSCDQEAIRLIKEGPKWKRNAKKRTRVTVAF